MILVDSNVIIDISSEDPVWSAWSENALAQAAESDEMAINPIVYAEVSINYSKVELLDAALDAFAIRRLPLPYHAGFLAGRAFRTYRKRGGLRTSPLPDFYIGAHAAISGIALITRDRRRYATYFPTVRLIAPEVG